MGVSRSAYHDYRASRSHVVSPEKADLGERVRAVFDEHRRRYGSRRIAAELRAEGVSAGRRSVRSQMLRLGLRAIQPKRFVPRTTDSRTMPLSVRTCCTTGRTRRASRVR